MASSSKTFKDSADRFCSNCGRVLVNQNFLRIELCTYADCGKRVRSANFELSNPRCGKCDCVMQNSDLYCYMCGDGNELVKAKQLIEVLKKKQAASLKTIDYLRKRIEKFEKNKQQDDVDCFADGEDNALLAQVSILEDNLDPVLPIPSPPNRNNEVSSNSNNGHFSGNFADEEEERKFASDVTLSSEEDILSDHE